MCCADALQLCNGFTIKRGGEEEEDIQEEPLKTHRPLCSSAAPKVRFNQFSFL